MTAEQTLDPNSGRAWRACTAGCLTLALGFAAASAAQAYSAQITMDAGSSVYLLDRNAPAAVTSFPPQTYYTNLNVPITASRDTTISAGPSAGQFVATAGAYNAWIEPGGMHLSARSAASISYAAVAGDDRYLRAQDGGSVQVAFDDSLTFGIAGAAPGTPFLVDVRVAVDGDFGVFGGAPGSPITPNAYASGTGAWAFDLLVPGGRPAGVLPTVTNRFSDGAWFGVRDDGSTFNQFSQYGYPKTVTVTMYAVTGAASLLEMSASLMTGAFADATYWPGATGSVEAGVHGNLADTVAWGGIAAVRRLDGSAVALSALSVQSTSGFDYTKAYVSSVPEPSAAGLMTLGAFGVWFARRRVPRSGTLPA